MKIIKYKKLKSNKYKIYLDNDEEIVLYDEVILNNNLLLTKEITNLNKLLKENEEYDAYFLSLKYINKKLRSKKELYKYLDKKFDINIIEDTIKKIEKEGYLNDDIYIKSYIHDQVELTSNGYFKILRDLKNNGLDEEIIKKYLDEINNDVWTKKANKLINKMIKTNTKYSTKHLKEKILYDLNNKGYDNSLILDLVNNIDIEDERTILEKNYKILYNKLSKKYSGKELELQLLTKLMSKGFNYNEVKKCINK